MHTLPPRPALPPTRSRVLRSYRPAEFVAGQRAARAAQLAAAGEPEALPPLRQLRLGGLPGALQVSCGCGVLWNRFGCCSTVQSLLLCLLAGRPIKELLCLPESCGRIPFGKPCSNVLSLFASSSILCACSTSPPPRRPCVTASTLSRSAAASAWGAFHACCFRRSGKGRSPSLLQRSAAPAGRPHAGPSHCPQLPAAALCCAVLRCAVLLCPSRCAGAHPRAANPPPLAAHALTPGRLLPLLGVQGGGASARHDACAVPSGGAPGAAAGRWGREVGAGPRCARFAARACGRGHSRKGCCHLPATWEPHH
jgi:hypothetical protein